VTVTYLKQVDLEQLTIKGEASVTVGGKRNGNVKVALNSNQVKSLQAGVHADGGGLYLVARESGERVCRSLQINGLQRKIQPRERVMVGGPTHPKPRARANDPLHRNIHHRTSLFSYRRADWYVGNPEWLAVGIIAIIPVQSPSFFQEQPTTFLNRA
jgi:hypothetical protein